MFPLSTVLFPGASLTLQIFEPRYLRLLDHCLAGDRTFGVVLIARGSEVGGGDERFSVATEAHIDQAMPLTTDRWALVVSGRRRLTIESWLADSPYPRAVVRVRPSQGRLDEAELVATAAAVARANALAAELGTGPGPGPLHPQQGGDLERRLWRLCDAAALGLLDRQRLLETDELPERAQLLRANAEAAGHDLLALLSRRSQDLGPGQ
jgi:Lon protease-like protein